MIPAAWDALRYSDNGDTCVVIGNGPSLKDVPVDFLNKYPTFGSNRVYLLFHPTYYACVNPLVLEQFADEIAQIDYQAKFTRLGYGIPNSFPLQSLILPCFSREPWLGVYEGFTVTYVLLQLAFFMGYKTVLLVGVDHRFEVSGSPNEQVVSQGADVNHFDPAYFGAGVKWNLPDLERSARAYGMAKTVFDNAGRKIVNLTPNTALDVFEKGELKDYL